jgi:uncharacterized cupredoxin-like copper-binding protein
MHRRRLLQRYFVVPAAGLLLLAAVAGCADDDDDDDDLELTVVPTNSTVPAGTATTGSSGTATPASGTPATAAGVATGSPSGEGVGTDGTGTSVSSEQVLQVTITDEGIEPSTLQATPGQITFEITNDGTTVHTLGLDIDDAPSVSPDVQPGETETWTINFDTTGDHDLYSLVDGEKESGLQAVLTIAE